MTFESKHVTLANRHLTFESEHVTFENRHLTFESKRLTLKRRVLLYDFRVSRVGLKAHEFLITNATTDSLYQPNAGI